MGHVELVKTQCPALLWSGADESSDFREADDTKEAQYGWRSHTSLGEITPPEHTLPSLWDPHARSLDWPGRTQPCLKQRNPRLPVTPHCLLKLPKTWHHRISFHDTLQFRLHLSVLKIPVLSSFPCTSSYLTPSSLSRIPPTPPALHL